MPRDTRSRTWSDSGPSSPPDGLSAALNDDQIARWADLIADGRDCVPDGLRPPERGRLEVAVRRRLRDRLVHLIARAIATRLRRGDRPDTEVSGA
jgi:hypothetical protein